MAPIRILILEDNPADVELAQYTLSSAGFNFVSKIVETRDEYVHALSDFSPDLILSDYDLPNFNGSDALDIVREIRPEVPFILFTGAQTGRSLSGFSSLLHRHREFPARR